MPPPKTNLIAISCLFACAHFCASSVGACSKQLSDPISVPTILFFQSAICLLLTLPLLFRHGWGSLKTERLSLHFARDLAGMASFFCFFYSIETIPLVHGFLLQSTGPLWLPFIAFVCFKIKMRPVLWQGILIGFIGVLLILKPGIEPLSLGIVIALFSGVFSGFTVITVNRLAETEPRHRILFYYFLVGTLITAACALPNFVLPTPQDFLFLLGVGCFTFITQMLVVTALRRAKAALLAPIAYTAVIFSGFYDWVFWNYLPDSWTLIGILFVVSGAILSIYHEKRFEKQISM